MGLGSLLFHLEENGRHIQLHALLYIMSERKDRSNLETTSANLDRFLFYLKPQNSTALPHEDVIVT